MKDINDMTTQYRTEATTLSYQQSLERVSVDNLYDVPRLDTEDNKAARGYHILLKPQEDVRLGVKLLANGRTLCTKDMKSRGLNFPEYGTLLFIIQYVKYNGCRYKPFRDNEMEVARYNQLLRDRAQEQDKRFVKLSSLGLILELSIQYERVIESIDEINWDSMTNYLREGEEWVKDIEEYKTYEIKLSRLLKPLSSSYLDVKGTRLAKTKKGKNILCFITKQFARSFTEIEEVENLEEVKSTNSSVRNYINESENKAPVALFSQLCNLPIYIP